MKNIPFLADIGSSNDPITPAQILAFVTGATTIPPMGFPQPITVKFIDDRTKKLPTASTCALKLRLPLSLSNYADFKKWMDMALLNTVGFGQV